MDSSCIKYRFFPHKSFRPHQKEGLERIRACAQKGIPLLFNSPTGTGKTAMVLGGVLEARGAGEKIAVITRTHSQYRIFAEEFARIKRKQPELTLGMLVGRSNVCPMNAGHVECGILRKNSVGEIRKGVIPLYPRAAIQNYRSTLLRAKNPVCPYYANCYQRNTARPLYNKEAMQLIQKQMDEPKTHEEFRRLCSESAYPKCPYELMKATLAKSDAAILHYQYLLDPDVRSAVLSASWLGAGPEEIHLIIDEAHNLAPYIQDITSLECTKKDVEDSIKLLRDKRLDDVKYSLKDLGEDETRVMLLLTGFGLFLEQWFARKNAGELSGEGSVDVVHAGDMYKPDAESLRFLEHAAGQVLRQFESKKMSQEIPEEMPLPGICRVAAVLGQATDANSGRHIRTMSIKPLSSTAGRRLDGAMSSGDCEIALKIADIDPRDAVGYLAENFRSLTLISGTLGPTQLYRKLLFHDKIDADEMTIPFPFPQENRLVLSCGNVSSQKKLRESEKNIEAVKDCIKALFSAKGNIAIFFTGYETKKQYAGYCEEQCRATGKKLMEETREIDRSRFIEEYKRHGNAALIGVCRGSFSEGVDYIGEAMNAVAVIGLPLAPWNTKQGMINAYYERTFGPGIGKTIAYELPAVTAAVQAAGRCLRSPEDTGVIILADSRYCNNTALGVRKILPEWMQNEMESLEAQELAGAIKQKLEEWENRPAAEKKEVCEEPAEEEPGTLPMDAGELYAKLRAWRMGKAREKMIIPYRILNKETLQALVDRRPRSLAELAAVRGIGQKKMDEYGEELLFVIHGAKPEKTKEENIPDEEEITRIILETVGETNEKYGAGRIAEILAGSKSRQVRYSGLERLGNYGRLAHLTQKAVEERIDALVKKRVLYRTWGLYPVLKIRK